MNKFTEIKVDKYSYLPVVLLVELFKQRVNELVLLHNVILPDGKVMVKGGAVYDLLKDLIEYQKQLRLNNAYDTTKKPKFTQVLNPKSKHWVLIDKANGIILGNSKKKYENVPVAVKLS